MMITYQILTGKYALEDVVYIGYGVQALCEGKAILQIEDISSDGRKTEDLVQLWNVHKLSPIHIMDVLEDFLTDL